LPVLINKPNIPIKRTQHLNQFVMITKYQKNWTVLVTVMEEYIKQLRQTFEIGKRVD
jgi:hypothetical protein